MYIVYIFVIYAEFPGSKAVSEASSNFGPSYVSGPISFVFEKVSTFIVTKDKKEEEPATADVEAKATSAEEVGVKEKEIVVEAGESKKEEEPSVADVAPTAKVEDVPAPADVAPAAKMEEAPAAAAPEPPKA